KFAPPSSARFPICLSLSSDFFLLSPHLSFSLSLSLSPIYPSLSLSPSLSLYCSLSLFSQSLPLSHSPTYPSLSLPLSLLFISLPPFSLSSSSPQTDYTSGSFLYPHLPHLSEFL